ncbi:MAG: glutamate-5-semialdehyde dehydrogenase [Spirochaetes bacterium GWD1_27_9]|nr:MAG: glutamate-5-semialdehyde dehydrogenase [Spirochaetes bacterium GWB1_27_13]OHD22626.1 MAG: glutamate-5-semialdehyde dehydrogenase [Spirochaetes bacterium GWC1_27_15]OHD34346.1 MAG: glutamate-5-semialdehyde dehydrogenase [Spirochaetes bacterium GWD1_27_9]
MEQLENILSMMKKASTILANTSTDLRNSALLRIANNLQRKSTDIFEANNLDLMIAEKENLASPLLKRLKLDTDKLNTVIDGINSLIKLPDPINTVLAKTLLDDNLILTKITVPIGVIGVIFESRPDALIQIATLCLKSGNCAILKGGREALNTNKILTQIIVDSILEVSSDFNNTIYLIETREDVAKILQYSKYINLIIPRGSNEFVQYIQKNSAIPVLGHADGICHLFVDSNTDVDLAVKLTVDSKTQYVAVCNALETLLVHKDIAKIFLPVLKKEMDKKNTKLKGDKQTKEILPDIEDATEEDWKTEYLDYILSIKVVNDVYEAIDHINKYGSGHTDSIVTKNKENAAKFQALVDSASVLVNCSTRFSDGYRYGFGAEVGISTGKIHSRGPVGLDGLIIYKYLVEGDGQIVDDYSKGIKKFKHHRLV